MDVILINYGINKIKQIILLKIQLGIIDLNFWYFSIKLIIKLKNSQADVKKNLLILYKQ